MHFHLAHRDITIKSEFIIFGVSRNLKKSRSAKHLLDPRNALSNSAITWSGIVLHHKH